MSRRTLRLGIIASFTMLLSIACGPPAAERSSDSLQLQATAAITPPPLGSAASFAVLGGAGVTCTESTVTGDAGSLLTVTQTPTCTISGAVHQGDAAAVAAFASAFTSASNPYDALQALPCPAANNLTGKPLGGMTLAPGVYCFDTTADLTTGTLTLDGPASGIWVFQVGTAITTGTASVLMAGGGQPCNVFWRLGTAATIGTGSAFQGNILAGSAITFTGAGSSLVGRALAKTAVTMTGTTISGSCRAGAPGGGGGGGGSCGDDDHRRDHHGRSGDRGHHGRDCGDGHDGGRGDHDEQDE